MELIYMYIERSYSGVLKKQSISFTDEFEVSLSEDKRILTIAKNENYYNIFRSNNNSIENVNAIVGKNGAGKTTLMREIFSGMSNNANSNTLFIEVYHYRDNTEGEKSCFKFNITPNHRENIIIKEGSKKIESPEYWNESIELTKIFVSNENLNQSQAIYNKAGLGEESKVPCLLELTQPIYSRLSDLYSDRITGHIDLSGDLYDNYNKYFRKNISLDFQMICDIKYIDKLVKNNQYDKSAIKMPSKLVMRLALLADLKKSMEKLMEDLKAISLDTRKADKSGEEEPHVNKIKRIEFWLSIIDKEKNTKRSFIEGLKFYYILEHDMKKNDFDENSFIYSKNKDTDKEFLDVDSMCKELQDGNETISEIESLISNSQKIMNTYDIKIDSNIGVIFEINDFKNMIDLLSKEIENHNSFIIKYLRFEKFPFSSGERAYFNIFSRINLLKFFNSIDSDIEESTREHIILLIDEIDLYLHPQWQRDFLSILLKDLELQFNEKKIQVIFSTHSPIMLSDIPRSNIVYLDVKKGHNSDMNSSLVDDRRNHKETFGANIYNLFNDSFFLDKEDENLMMGVQGKFASKNINRVNEFLLAEIEGQVLETSMTIEEAEKIIGVIGEDVLRRHLIAKLEKVKQSYISNELSNVTKKYQNLSKSDKEKFIKAIIKGSI